MAKCPECKPGLPGWMATFSDMMTLLLTFFIMLVSFAKFETAKYEAALGSVLNAFGGNVLLPGDVLQLGKSADNAPTMLDAQESARPFPIEFLTSEGMLDKLEINRDSDEQLSQMRNDLVDNGLQDVTDLYEISEGIKVSIKEHILFKEGSTKIQNINIEAFDKTVKLLANKDWVVFVQGYSARGEQYIDELGNKSDALMLSALRAQAVTKSLIARSVRPDKIETVFYGDTKPLETPGRTIEQNRADSRRVTFILRKVGLNEMGRKVKSQ